MRSRYKVTDTDGVYFLTSTIVEWLPVFHGTETCEILCESLQFCRKEKRLRLYAYVIMENHLHLLCDAPDLSSVMRSFKRFTAQAILEWAESTRREWLLNQFAYYRKKEKRESAHQVWQEGFHPIQITGDAMLIQKIEYIHNNPVRRGYVDAPEHWRYSSARNYYQTETPVMPIDMLGEEGEV